MDGVHLYRQPSSGQSRVHQVLQLRTEGVYRSESTAIRPVYIVLKVEFKHVACASCLDNTTDHFVSSTSFLTPALVFYRFISRHVLEKDAKALIYPYKVKYLESTLNLLVHAFICCGAY